MKHINEETVVKVLGCEQYSPTYNAEGDVIKLVTPVQAYKDTEDDFVFIKPFEYTWDGMGTMEGRPERVSAPITYSFKVGDTVRGFLKLSGEGVNVQFMAHPGPGGLEYIPMEYLKLKSEATSTSSNQTSTQSNTSKASTETKPVESTLNLTGALTVVVVVGCIYGLFKLVQ